MADEGRDLLEFMAEVNRPRVKKREWMDTKHMELVTTVERLREVVDLCIASKLYGFDLETTGLDHRVFPGPDQGHTIDRIVGFCLSPDGESGFYVPVRHLDEKGESLPCNITPRLAAEELRRLANSDAVAIFHHGKFDQEFLEFCEQDGPIGCWDNHDKWEDTHILAYLRNPRERNKGLKFLSAQELGMDMIELDELFLPEDIKKNEGKLDFSRLDPNWEPCVWYACSDAICTFLLFKKLHPVIMDPEPHGRNQETVYKMEKMCVTATRWMERCRIYIDRTKVEELIRLGQQEWFESMEVVYDEASKILGRNLRPGWFRIMQGMEGSESYRFDPMQMEPNYMQAREVGMERASTLHLDPVNVGTGKVEVLVKQVPSLTNAKAKENVEFPVVYDVTVPAELGLLLREMGAPGLRATEKSGQVKTSKAEIDRVIEMAGTSFPFMGKVKRFRETAKALGTNLFPLLWDTAPDRSKDGTVMASFNAFKADTGRFSTPTPSDKAFHGQVRWNVHSIPATYQKDRPACMLRIRELVRTRPPAPGRPKRIMFAIDFSGVELRIVTNLSREPKWLDEFFRCSSCGQVFDRGDGRETPEAPPPFCPVCGSDKIGDLHSLTALSVYGEGIAADPKLFKEKRQCSKALNFAMCYGGGGMAAQRAVNVDKDEGWRIKRQFDASYRGLRAWWETQHNFARKYQYVTTAFHRRYPVPDINHEMGEFRSKAERNSVNGPVQGTSADIMKLAMALLYREFKKRGWLAKVLMVITIHDELVFEIDDDIAEDAIDVIVPIMTVKTVKNLRHPVPLKVDVEMGDDWMVSRNLTEMKWNKAKKGAWTAYYAKVFPRTYAHYLKCGGEPVEGAPTPPAEPDPAPPTPEAASPSSPPSSSPPPAPIPTSAQPVVSPPVTPLPMASEVGKSLDLPKTAKGETHVHVLHSTKLSYTALEKMAKLIVRCDGGGTQPLRIETEAGDILWDNPQILINPVQFYVLALEHGL